MMVAHLRLPTGNSLRIVRGTVKELTDACASAMAWDHDTARDYVIRNQIVKDEPLERTGRRYTATQLLSGAKALLRIARDEVNDDAVPDAVARMRVNICRTCPFVVVATDCAPCTIAGAVASMVTNPLPEALDLGCDICGCSLAVMTRTKSFDEPETTERPSYCWVKKNI